jgi:Rrf2 family iron-sulfur cluster assembly transcriptional regulator
MSEVSVVDIILAVDEPIDATQCGGKENCYNDQRCMTHDLWASLNARIRDYLAVVTLEQLVANPKVKDIAVLQDMRSCKSEEETVLA